MLRQKLPLLLLERASFGAEIAPPAKQEPQKYEDPELQVEVIEKDARAHKRLPKKLRAPGSERDQRKLGG